MTSNKKDLDGAARNAARMVEEAKKVSRAIFWGFRDLFQGGTGHGIFGDIVDIPVEAIRASPYFWGHVVMLWGVWELGYFVYTVVTP